MATLILFKGDNTSFFEITTLLLAILIASLVVYITLRNAQIISDKLGVTGLKITTRVLGLIVGAISVQFIVKGIYTLWTLLK
jgi:multiple antibiotic resistance protein